MQCLNCDTEVEKNYCPNCGQKSYQPRLTLKVLFGIVVQTIFDIDRGFFYTCKEMLLRPEIVISNYLQGKRVIYSNPIKFLLIWLGFTLFISLSVVDMDKVMTQTIQTTMEASMGDSTKVNKLFKGKNDAKKQYLDISLKAALFVSHNQQLLYSILIPFTAMFLTFFFRKQGYYFTEHLVFIIYSYAAYHILFSGLTFIYLLESINLSIINGVLSLTMMLFIIYTAIKFYGLKENKWRVALKVALVQIISMVLYSIFFGIAINLYAMIIIALKK